MIVSSSNEPGNKGMRVDVKKPVISHKPFVVVVVDVVVVLDVDKV